MPTAKKKTDLFQPTPLGMHKGLPVLDQGAIIQKGNRVVKGTMNVAPFEVEPAGDVDMAMRLHQVSERFVNIMSEDDPDVLLGYERVVVFDCVGAVPNETPESTKALDEMIARVADEEERKKQERAGQFRLPKAEDDDNVVDIKAK
jgi:hypothetical protein